MEWRRLYRFPAKMTLVNARSVPMHLSMVAPGWERGRGKPTGIEAYVSKEFDIRPQGGKFDSAAILEREDQGMSDKKAAILENTQ